MRLFVWGSNTIQDARDASALGFRPLVGPSLFISHYGDGGDYSKPFAGPASNHVSSLGPWGLVSIHVVVITSPVGRP
jgi:hypothetical protein